jgi:hypothetical protein
MNKLAALSLNKETIRQLDDSDLAYVVGGSQKFSSALAPTATAGGGGKVSSVMPGKFKPTATATPTHGGKVSSVAPGKFKPTATAVGGGQKMSSVRPSWGAVKPTATATPR